MRLEDPIVSRGTRTRTRPRLAPRPCHRFCSGARLGRERPPLVLAEVPQTCRGRLIGPPDLNPLRTRRQLLIGSGARLQKVLSSFSDEERATEFIGFLHDGPDSTDKGTLLGVPCIGSIEDLDSVLDRYVVDQVIVALPKDSFYDNVCMIANICDFHRVNIFIPADFNGLLKMIEDKIIAALGLFLLLPVLIILSLLIKLDSPGPILFRQLRYGYRNELISVYKFRTMYAHQTDPDGKRLTERTDRRVTRIGRFLRKTSLDELPQLLNVIRGEMSIVGPRPHAQAAAAEGIPYEKTTEDYVLRHCVKPGITGWAQVNGWRGETETLEQIWNRVVHDIYYVENWSVLLDIKIILRTAWQLLQKPREVF